MTTDELIELARELAAVHAKLGALAASAVRANGVVRGPFDRARGEVFAAQKMVEARIGAQVVRNDH